MTHIPRYTVSKYNAAAKMRILRDSWRQYSKRWFGRVPRMPCVHSSMTDNAVSVQKMLFSRQLWAPVRQMQARRAACRGPALRHFVYSIRVVGCFNYSCARIPLGDSAVHKIDRSANFAGHRYAGLILLIAKLPVLDFE